MARWFENLPYTNFHDLNLDWIVKLMKQISDAEDAQNSDIADLKERVSDTEKWIRNYDPNLIRATVLEYISSILAAISFSNLFAISWLSNVDKFPSTYIVNDI